MNSINTMLSSFNDFLWVYVLIGPLLALGLYFSYKTKFVQFGYFKEMIRLLGDGFGKSSDTEDKKGKKGVSSFQAFCISTASRVGTGNITGVTMAIATGGPGAVFWMWLIAFIGSASSFVESTLAQIYKVKDGENFRGGPAYYMEKALGKKWMGILFSILITICFGFVFNSVQSNTVSQAFQGAFNFKASHMGILLAILTGLVIFGGVQRIAKVSEIIVPIFAMAYILVAILIICLNITSVPTLFKTIFQNAFGINQIAGGTLGAVILQGVKRGLFSNEAGMGSAPNAAATADVSHPVKQGLIQTLGVFTDTILICTCTAFIILIAGNYTDATVNGIQLTQAALVSQLGPFGSYFIALCIFLFAFSSIIGNYYYGESNIEFIIPKNKIVMIIYRALVVGMVFFGALAKVSLVWTLADIFMAFMAILNLIAIALLGKISFAALEDYRNQKKKGIKEPVFYKDSIPGLQNIECWEESPFDEEAL